EPEATGRPACHPSTLLKIYVYGYLNRGQSRRSLERECQRDIEMVWLTGRLMADFKTIADFRKDNGEAIRKVCREFVVLCRRLELFSEASVAIDGSKFKAVNTRDRNFTQAKMQRRLAQIDESIAPYLSQLDSADRQGEAVPEAKITRLNEKIATLRQEIQRLNGLNTLMMQTEDKQISLTDPDARSMATSGRGSGMVGYNVQTAVDAKHHLIVAHEVTNVGNDRTQLSKMAEQAKTAMGADTLDVLADRGYFKGEEILACEAIGVTPFVPKSLTSGAKAEGRFGKQDFVYITEDDTYRGPAGERLTRRYTSVENGMDLHVYWTTACLACPLKSQCTTGTERRIKRWEHEAVIDAMQQRLDRAPNVMHIRRQTVEHPFGTIKSWMGATHFLTRSLGKVRTEMSLHVLAYNLKRVIAILGLRLSWRRCGPETAVSPIPPIRRPAYGSAATPRSHLHPRQIPSRFC